jgi:hypothetical protein
MFTALDAALDFVADRMPELTGPGGVILWKAYVRYALSLDELEQAVVTMLLAGEHGVCSVLRAQITVCTCVERTFFGGGFSMSFCIPSDAPRVNVTDDFSSLECRTRGKTWLRSARLRRPDVGSWCFRGQCIFRGFRSDRSLIRGDCGIGRRGSRSGR